MVSAAELDELAARLYTSTDNAARQQAQAALDRLLVEGSDIAVFHEMLQSSTSQYTLMFLAQGLVTWFKANGKYLDFDQQRDLIVNRCGQCLQRVAVASAPRHVMLSLLSMYARLTKFTFEKEPYLTEAVTDVVQLLNSTYEQCASTFSMNDDGSSQAKDGSTASGSAPAGGSIEESRRLHLLSLVLLDSIVNEFSKYDASRVGTFMIFATHRRCSNNFRDECMLGIFEAVLRQLRLLTPKGFIREVVDLVKDCLTYDFMAIMVDETEDALSSQFPSTWKPVMLSTETLDILWGQQLVLPYPYCETLMDGLASVCGIRRTFFENSEERVAYLDVTLQRVIHVVQSATDDRMANPRFVNSFGEACGRLIAPFGYRDLHQSRMFESWVGAMRDVSLAVFAVPFGQDGSFTTATTFLQFWARLCTSRRMYAGLDEPPSDLERISPDLTLAIFRSRVRQPWSPAGDSADGSASASGANGPSGGANRAATPTGRQQNTDMLGLESLADDMDSAMEAVLTQADAIASVAILEQKRTMELLASYVLNELGPAILSSSLSTGWLFHIASSLVRQVLGNLEDSALEGCGNFFMFCVDCVNVRRLSPNDSGQDANATLGNSFVERGLLSMLTNMHNIFSHCRPGTALASIVDSIFTSRKSFFQFILNNTGHNLLRAPSGSADEETADVMRASIDLIGEACREVGHDILRELSFNLPPAVELPLSQHVNTYKLRTNLYQTLWPLCYAGMQGNTSEDGPRKTTREILQRFLAPVVLCMQQTMANGERTSSIYVAGWMRDLRGVAMALQDDCAHGPEALSCFMEWFCDEYSVFQSVLASPLGESPMVVTSFLRLMIALVDTRGGRMSLPGFDNHSTLGLSLFKSQCDFIRQIVERCVTEEHIRLASQSGASADSAYDSMMKPLTLCMTCLRKSIGDSFVPLGAMWFYGDDTYDSTLLGLLRMLGVFSADMFKFYPETLLAVTDLLRAVCEDDSFQPLAKLSTADLRVVLEFVFSVCEDTKTATATLLHGLAFLGFISGFVKDVKALSLSPELQAAGGQGGSDSLAVSRTTPPSLSPVQLPQYYAMPGTGRISGTPGSGGRSIGGGPAGKGRKTSRLARDSRAAIARALEPIPDLWERLIHTGMNVVVLQDRAMSASCSVVYPVMETYPPFWFRFVDRFVQTYPAHKQEPVREALSTLMHAAQSSEQFFSEVFTLRQTLRNL